MLPLRPRLLLPMKPRHPVTKLMEKVGFPLRMRKPPMMHVTHP